MDITYFNYWVYSWTAIALITFVVLVVFEIRAPYGRHTNAKWGKAINNKWGWFWMELPAFLLFPLLALSGPSEKTAVFWLLIGLWTLHYFYRTLIFPFQLRTKGKKMPLAIVFSALFFNGVNGFINGYFLGYLASDTAALFSLNVLLGLILYFAGMFINMVSDRKLIALRTNNTDYQIPKGWLFDYISCPNHFGEIIEWIGFALVAWNLPAVTFAIWTFSNLVPRALNHHAWYLEKFDSYPKNRKAVFPYLW